MGEGSGLSAVAVPCCLAVLCLPVLLLLLWFLWKLYKSVAVSPIAQVECGYEPSEEALDRFVQELAPEDQCVPMTRLMQARTPMGLVCSDNTHRLSWTARCGSRAAASGASRRTCRA